jgi:uncharacterized protein YdaU (DUF1376 family)
MEHGAYMLLLMAAWTRGGILPKRAGALASITKLSLAEWDCVSEAVLPFFIESEEGYRHKRVSEEYEKAQRLSEARREIGKLGGRPKKQNETKGKPIGLANGKQTGNLNETPAQVARPSPLQLPSEVSNSVPIGPELERAGATPAQRAMALELIETVRSPDKPKAPKPSRRAPSEWAPSEATTQTLAAEGYQPGQLERELAILRDHEFKTARSDWDACFRNWVRRSSPQTLRVINEQPRYTNRTSDYVSKLQDIGAAMVADFEQ